MFDSRIRCRLVVQLLIKSKNHAQNRFKSDDDQEEVKKSISRRENELLPVYEQIDVQFCEIHDTPGRMDAVGVIERQIEWKESRSFFSWRLRRKLATTLRPKQ